MPLDPSDPSLRVVSNVDRQSPGSSRAMTGSATASAPLDALEDMPGLLDYNWDATLPPDPAGQPAGSELFDPFALFKALKDDTRPLLRGPVDVVLREITRRIVCDWRPLRILLFGSCARGQARPESDIDLLVELATYTTAQHALLGLYRTIGRTDPVVDVLVSRPDILAAHKGHLSTVLGQALRDGRVLYELSVTHESWS